jgi:anthranilate 1,2-dioxygenase small subunit
MALDEDRTLGRIARLLTEYVHCIDDGRYEEWPDFFTETCLYRIASKVNIERGMQIGLVHCDSRAMLRDRISSLRRANIYEPHAYRHMVSAARLVGTDGDALHVRSNFHVARIMHDGATSLFCTGLYDDRIVEADGRLLFRERTVVCDSSRVDTLLVIPL